MGDKDLRFGLVLAAICTATTTGASCGAVNAMIDRSAPPGGLVPMFLIQLGEILPGGVGTGFNGMLIHPRFGTPEYKSWALTLSRDFAVSGTGTVTAIMGYYQTTVSRQDCAPINGRGRDVCGAEALISLSFRSRIALPRLSRGCAVFMMAALRGNCASSPPLSGGRRTPCQDRWKTLSDSVASCSPPRRCTRRSGLGGLGHLLRDLHRVSAAGPELAFCGLPEQPLGRIHHMLRHDPTTTWRLGRRSRTRVHCRGQRVQDQRTATWGRGRLFRQCKERRSEAAALLDAPGLFDADITLADDRRPFRAFGQNRLGQLVRRTPPRLEPVAVEHCNRFGVGQRHAHRGV